MVDGIKIDSPLLPGTVEARDAASRKPVAFQGAQGKQPATKADPLEGSNPEKISSVIRKAAEKKLSVLTSGSVLNFVEAAEKIIEATLPQKPPGTRLRIDIDDASGRFVYQGVDIKTGEVVTQFPSDDILKFVAFNRERSGAEGIVVDEEA